MVLLGEPIQLYSSNLLRNMTHSEQQQQHNHSNNSTNKNQAQNTKQKETLSIHAHNVMKPLFACKCNRSNGQWRSFI